jgi:hypothetical protein
MVFKAGWGSKSGLGHRVVGEDALLEDGATVLDNGSLDVVLAICVWMHCMVGGWALLDDGSFGTAKGGLVVVGDKVFGRDVS